MYLHDIVMDHMIKAAEAEIFLILVTRMSTRNAGSYISHNATQ